MSEIKLKNGDTGWEVIFESIPDDDSQANNLSIDLCNLLNTEPTFNEVREFLYRRGYALTAEPMKGQRPRKS